MLREQLGDKRLSFTDVQRRRLAERAPKNFEPIVTGVTVRPGFGRYIRLMVLSRATRVLASTLLVAALAAPGLARGDGSRIEVPLVLVGSHFGARGGHIGFGSYSRSILPRARGTSTPGPDGTLAGRGR